MNTFGILCGLTALACGIAGLWLDIWDRNRMYRRGREEGYEKGYKDGQVRADNWWLDAERDVERAAHEQELD